MYSCVEDNFDLDKLSDQIELRPAFVVPVATGSLTLANAIKPSENVVFDPDNLVRIIFREDSVIYIAASELFEFPEQSSVSKVFNLGSLMLEDFGQYKIIELGDMKENMNPALKSFFEDNDGMETIFPVVGPSAMGSYNLEVFNDFDYIHFTEGTLQLWVSNYLPVPVSLTAELRNQSDNSLVGSFAFSNITAPGTDFQSIDLAGKRIDNALRIDLTNFYTPGSSPSEVAINLADVITFDITGESIKSHKAKSYIPNQIIETDEQFVNIDTEGPEQLYRVALSKGRITYNVNSFRLEGLYLSVDLPETRRNNQQVNYNLPLYQAGGGIITGNFDMTGTSSDLTNDPLQAFNRLPVNYELGIITTGHKIEFDLSEENLNFTYTIEEIDFYYVEGWLGEKAIDVDDEVFDFENEVNDFYEKFSGEVRLTNPIVRLAYENLFGVPVRMNFNMTGYGKEGEMVVLNPPVIDFLAPSDTIQGAYEGSAEVNRDNSSIVDMIAIPPRRIEFSGSANANPGGTPATNFVKGNSYFLANLEVDIPLELQITNLSFTDSIKFGLGSDLDMFDNVFLHFIVENGFPFELTLDFHFRDTVDNKNLVSFPDIVIMKPAPVNTEGIVTGGQKTVSTEKIELTPEKLDDIKISNQLVVTARMSSSESGNRPVKILSNYELKFNIRVSSSLIIN